MNHDAIQSHPEEDGFPFESGCSQGFFLVSSGEIFSLTTDSLVRDLNAYFCEAALYNANVKCRRGEFA